MKKIILLVILILAATTVSAATLECQVESGCTSGRTNVLGLDALTNAQSELASQSNYAPRVCCRDSDGTVTIGTSSGGANFIDLSDTTNAHVEKITEGNYANDAYISSETANYDIQCHYEDSASGTCASGECLMTMEADTNAHAADCDSSPYARTVCCQITFTGQGQEIIPEFSTVGMIVAILVIFGATIFIVKKQPQPQKKPVKKAAKSKKK